MLTYCWNDIGWHFLIGGDGKSYEGRGWYFINEISVNSRELLISFIGNFTDYEAPQRQLYAAQRFVEDEMEMKKIAKDCTIHAHKSLRDDHSFLYNQIMLWSNASKLLHNE